MARPWILAAAALLAGCGGAPLPASAPAPAASADPAASAAKDPSASANEAPKPSTELPTSCEARDDKLCLPPAAFVKRLCGGFYADVALSMFAKGTPWTRGYLRREVEAWNASGGVSSADKLVFEEEVLLVVHREADAGGMVVSGSSGSYDVLRWDGTCASLMGEEVTTKPPRVPPKHAKIPWKSLGEPLREALLANEKIGKVSAERKKECKGATMGEVSIKCVKADTMLSVSVVEYVRSGGALPPPSKMP
jgi:hypothetical protein